MSFGQNLAKALVLSTILLIVSSCTNYKRIPYFQDIQATAKLDSTIVPHFQVPVIQPDDVLSITIQTLNPQNFATASQSISMPSVGLVTTSSASNEQLAGYLVDSAGNVDLPMIGTIKLQGLTTQQARELIRLEASKHYKAPLVQVRYANFKITVLGEVARPASYIVPNEKVSVLDALGLAGDLTIYGKRENVLLIREDSTGGKEFVRMNLNSSKIFESPFFYLKQNDVLYVEPTKAKLVASDASRTRVLMVGASVVSALLVLLIRVL